jgi:urease accessory protein
LANGLNKMSELSACPIKLNRLLQLCSANLPVGGFSFSQGLEYAVEAGWIVNSDSTKSWILLNLTESLAQTDVAILKRLYAALIAEDFEAFLYWNTHIVACRESSELLLSDIAMGKALVRLMKQLDGINIDKFAAAFKNQDCSFVTAFALCAYQFKLDLLSVQSGYCWTYIDNQVSAATKLVPLGQTQAQNLLFTLSEHTQSIIEQANAIHDDSIGSSLPHLAMASAWHETQYSRLFRS